MASITRTSGVTINTTGSVEQFIGKAMKFFAVIVKNGSGEAQDLSSQFAAEGAIDLINQAITSVGATIILMQYNGTGQISYALEGAVGNWSATTSPTSLQAAIRALVTANGVDVSGTTVTDVDFKLATA